MTRRKMFDLMVAMVFGISFLVVCLLPLFVGGCGEVVPDSGYTEKIVTDPKTGVKKRIRCYKDHCEEVPLNSKD